MDKTVKPIDKMDMGNNKKRVRQRKMNLYGSIRKQMEFYFSSANLQKDRFLKQLVMSEPDGFVDVETFLSFNKIKTLTSDVTFILKAIKDSDLLMADESGKRIGRKVKFEEPQDTDKRTVYAEFLPKDVTIDWLINHFSKAGKVVHISLPKFKSTGDYKGFAFVEFETPEGASKACELLNSPPKNAPKPGIFAKTCKTGRHMMDPLKQQTTDTDTTSIMEENKREEDVKELKTPKKEMKFSEKMEMIDGDLPADSSNDIASQNSSAEKKSKKRRKSLESNGSLPPVKVQKLQTSENDHKSKALKHDPDNSVKTENLELSEMEKSPKKKSMKKKGLKQKVEPIESGLRVISKQDWLQYRQEYYEKHKQNMSELKTKIREVKLRNFGQNPVKMDTDYNKHDNHESMEMVAKEKMAEPKEEGLSFVPKVIIKVTLAEPVSKKFLKEQMLEKGKVAFLDMMEGDLTAHARCMDADSAEAILKGSTPECQYALLEGNEEKMYWDKVFSDREKRLSTKTKKKFRGSDRVMAKADRVLKVVKQKAIHMVFED